MADMKVLMLSTLEPTWSVRVLLETHLWVHEWSVHRLSAGQIVPLLLGNRMWEPLWLVLRILENVTLDEESMVHVSEPSWWGPL